jgi:thiol reductant ABC exporter CydC subunit
VAALGRPVAARLLLAVLVGAAASAASVGLLSTSAWLISRAAERPPVLYLLVAVTAVRAFGVGRGVLRYLERLAAHDAAFRVLAELRSAVYVRLTRLAPGGLTDLRSGDLMARLVNDTDGLADLWLRVLLPFAVAGTVGLGAVAMIGCLVPAAGFVLAATLVAVALGAPAAALVVSRAAERRIAPARGELASAALDLLQGAPELFAAGATPRALDTVLASSRRLATAERRAARGAGAGSLVAGLAAGIAVWLSLVLAIDAARAGTLAGVAIAVVALTPIAIHEAVAPVAPAAREVPGLAASAARVTDVLDRPDPVREPARPSRPPGPPYGLRARGLRLRYAGAAVDAVAGLDLEIAAGGRAFVTGASGSGKSTLAAALLRFLDPAGGVLQLVGRQGAADITTVSGDDVRQCIGYCAQDPHVFDATVGDNLRLARPGATDMEIREAMVRAQLDAWVDSLPAGLETQVGERGARLSAGQRQRLSLARALLAGAPILLLDEPTEHLDEPAARAFVADLEVVSARRTVVVLTHRPDLFPAHAGWQHAADLGTPPATLPRTSRGARTGTLTRYGPADGAG